MLGINHSLGSKLVTPKLTVVIKRPDLGYHDNPHLKQIVVNKQQACQAFETVFIFNFCTA